jgi:hypothetical protein
MFKNNRKNMYKKKIKDMIVSIEKMDIKFINKSQWFMIYLLKKPSKGNPKEFGKIQDQISKTRILYKNIMYDYYTIHSRILHFYCNKNEYNEFRRQYNIIMDLYMSIIKNINKVKKEHPY